MSLDLLLLFSARFLPGEHRLSELIPVEEVGPLLEDDLLVDIVFNVVPREAAA